MTSPLFSATDRQKDIGLFILRLVTGVVFTAHGWQKVFGMGVGNIQGFFAKAGVPVPALVAPLVSYLELVGGIALILGLLTRLVALGFAVDMLGAMFFVHFAGGFFLPKGYEFVLELCAAAVAFAVAGGGRFSVDHAIATRRSTQ